MFDSVALILIEFGFAVMMCLVMGWLFVCCVSGLSLCCCWLNDWCLMVVYIGFWLCLFYGSWGCGLYVGTLGFGCVLLLAGIAVVFLISVGLIAMGWCGFYCLRIGCVDIVCWCCIVLGIVAWVCITVNSVGC